MIGRGMPVTRIFADVVDSDRSLAAERWREHLCVARHGKLGERLARYTRQTVEHVGFAARVGDVVKESSERGPRQARRVVGDGLHEPLLIKLCGKRAPDLVYDRQSIALGACAVLCTRAIDAER